MTLHVASDKPDSWCATKLLLFFFLTSCESSFFFFFFQAEDGIRDLTVTGVQTCALPISAHDALPADDGCREGQSLAVFVFAQASCRGCARHDDELGALERGDGRGQRMQIGRASCRERV